MTLAALLVTVVGLPVGPATEASVRAGLRINDDIDDESLEAVINAVNVRVLDFPYVDEFVDSVTPVVAPAEPTWPADIAHGATLLASRLFARRNSAEGVASFGDQGAVYVQRNDPDVALLLRIGAHAKPSVA